MKYTKASDKKQDAEVMKNMTPKQMLEFKKKDKKHRKPKSQEDDSKMDVGIAEKIMSKKKKKK
jgi:hypothetical protein